MCHYERLEKLDVYSILESHGIVTENFNWISVGTLSSKIGNTMFIQDTDNTHFKG